MDLKRILSRLVRLRPEARATTPLRQSGEHGLFRLLQAEGVGGVERLVASLNARGHGFQLVQRGAGTRTWTEQVEGGKRTIDIYIASRRSFSLTSLRCRSGSTPATWPSGRRPTTMRAHAYQPWIAACFSSESWRRM